MSSFAFALAAVFALGSLGADVAWADRGRGGGQHFQQRHDGAKFRHDGFRHARGYRDARAVPVHRRHRSASVGLHFGVPLYWHWPPPYYAYPPTVVTVPAPPPTVYIEREPEPAAGYWYYCYSPEGYYPYVRECPGGWERVSPTPPR